MRYSLGGGSIGHMESKPIMSATKKAMGRFTSPCLTLIEDRWGGWQPDCPITADKLHALGVDFGTEGISTAALDDVLYNVSEAGYWLETVPAESDIERDRR